MRQAVHVVEGLGGGAQEGLGCGDLWVFLSREAPLLIRLLPALLPLPLPLQLSPCLGKWQMGGNLGSPFSLAATHSTNQQALLPALPRYLQVFATSPIPPPSTLSQATVPSAPQSPGMLICYPIFHFGCPS